jgi:glycosyltransferase involved in cell wall biosynthesis
MPQGFYLAGALAQEGFAVTYCGNRVPSTFSDSNNLKDIKVKLIPLLPLIIKTKWQNPVNWLAGLLVGLKGYDIVIGVDNQGFVPAYFLKRAGATRKLVGYFLEYNSPRESPFSLATRLTGLFGKYSDIILDVEKTRLSFRKAWMGFSCPSFLVKNVPPYFGSPELKKPHHQSLRRDLAVLYQGHIGAENCLEELIQGVIACDFPIRLTLAGTGSPTYLERLQRLYEPYFQAKIVSYAGFLERARLKDLFGEHDLGVAFYSDKFGPNNYWCVPNKLFEYLSFNLPVVCSKNPSLTFVEREGIGLTVNTDNVPEISGAFKRFHSDRGMLLAMKKKCRQLFAQKYNYETQIRPFIKMLA